jgi:hypothetical protein
LIDGGGNRAASRAQLGARVLTLAGVAAALAVVAARKASDADLPWHLAMGRRILALGTVPRIDDFAADHRPIRSAETLSDVSLYLAEHAAGPLGLTLLAALTTLLLALTLWASARRAGAISVPVVALALAAAGPWLAPRPATFSFAFVALTLFLIDERRRHGGSRRGRRALFLIVPLTALWANFHGFVVLGVGLTFGYAAYAGLCRLIRDRAGAWFPREQGEDLGASVGVALLVLGAACLSFAGPRLLTAPFAAARDFGRIAEWQAPSLTLLVDNDPAALLLALLAALALLFGRNPETGRRAPEAFDLGLGLLALWLGASTVRMIPVGAAMAAPVLARRLGGFVRPLPAMRWAAALSATLVAPVLAIDPGFHLGRGFDLDRYPEGAVRFVLDAAPRGPMWNHLTYGGWLIWRLYPRHRVLVDGRTGWVHDPALVEIAIRSETDPEAFEELVHERGLEWAVSRATAGLPFGAALARSPEFAMIYLDDNAAVYARRDGENRTLAENGYRLLRHDAEAKPLIALALSGQRASDLGHDADLAVAQAPSSPRTAFFLACAGIALRDRARLDRALPLLDAATAAELQMAFRMRSGN